MRLLRAWLGCFAALCWVRVRPNPLLAVAVALLGLLTPLAMGTASAVELLEGKVTAGAAPVLQGAGGTVRLEQPRVNATDRTTFFAPEPSALWQLGSGIGLLALLPRRRRRRTASQTNTGAPGPADSATQKTKRTS
jgi:hypothetical protein